jgi:hypothetical protein
MAEHADPISVSRLIRQQAADLRHDPLPAHKTSRRIDLDAKTDDPGIAKDVRVVPSKR